MRGDGNPAVRETWEAAEAAGAAGRGDAVGKSSCSGLTIWSLLLCCGGEGRVQSTHGVGISRAPASIDESFSSSHVRLQIFRKIRLLTVVIVTPLLLASAPVAGSSYLVSYILEDSRALPLVFLSCLSASSLWVISFSFLLLNILIASSTF